MADVEEKDLLNYITGKTTDVEVSEQTEEKETKIEDENIQDNLQQDKAEEVQEGQEVVDENKEEVVEDKKDEDDPLLYLKDKYGIKDTEDTKVEASEESSLKDDNKEFDINSFVSEKTNGQFNSFDDLLNKINTQSEVKQDFASERIKRLNELEASGVDIMQVLEVDRLNVDGLNPDNYEDGISIVKAKLKLEDPSLTDQEIHYLIKKDYLFDEDEDEQDSVLYKKAKLKREAKSFKKEILDYKKRLELPDPSRAVNENNAELQRQQEEYKKIWGDSVSNFSKAYTSEEFKVSDDFTLNFGVTEEMKKQVTNDLQDPYQYLSRYTNENGQISIDKLVKERVIMNNLPLILRSLADQVKNNTAKSIIADLENSRPKGFGKKANNLGHQSFEQKALTELRKQNIDI